MKTFYLTFIVILICFSSISQNIVKSKKFKISFESSEKFENYETESDLLLGYENDNYAVDIEIVPLDNSIKNLRLSTRKLALNLGLQNIIDGGKIPEIEKSYYVITNDVENGVNYPVYVILIFNYPLKIAYEITVDAYNHNTIVGLEIVNSFKILD